MNNPILKTIGDCICYAQTINPKKDALISEKLRQFPGCEQYNEEEATRLVQTIDLLTTTLFETVVMERQRQMSQPETKPIDKRQQPYLLRKQNAA